MSSLEGNGEPGAIQDKCVHSCAMSKTWVISLFYMQQ